MPCAHRLTHKNLLRRGRVPEGREEAEGVEFRRYLQQQKHIGNSRENRDLRRTVQRDLRPSFADSRVRRKVVALKRDPRHGLKLLDREERKTDGLAQAGRDDNVTLK